MEGQRSLLPGPGSLGTGVSRDKETGRKWEGVHLGDPCFAGEIPLRNHQSGKFAHSFTQQTFTNMEAKIITIVNLY